MANYTQKAIMQVFEEMLAEEPFDKITVSALVARCEISSNTFYYHFRDIYDLLDAWLLSQKDRFLKKAQPESRWAPLLKSILHEMQDHASTVYHVFNSLSRALKSGVIDLTR